MTNLKVQDAWGDAWQVLPGDPGHQAGTALLTAGWPVTRIVLPTDIFVLGTMFLDSQISEVAGTLDEVCQNEVDEALALTLNDELRQLQYLKDHEAPAPTVLADVMTIAEAAKAMGVTTQGVHDRISRGWISSIKVSDRLLMIPKADVERFRGLGKLPSGPGAPEKITSMLAAYDAAHTVSHST